MRAANPPAPMRDVQIARIHLPDAAEALGRALTAWNATQLRDALRSVRMFIDTAEAALDAAQRDAEGESR